jgi:hypothetical protein
MPPGTVRVLRVESAIAQTGIDTIESPTLLAHHLLALDTPVQEESYLRKLRLSGIADVCVREQILGLRNTVVLESKIPLGLRVTFDIGNAIHNFLQNEGIYFGDSRLGWWRCCACGNRQFGRKPKRNCVKCSALPDAIQYHEHTLQLPEDVPVSGHPDNFLEVADGDIRIVDFKSINGIEFDKMTAPKAEHVMQLVGYMHYIGMDLSLPVKVNIQRGLIIYVSKKHTVKQLPFKAFHVLRSLVYIKVIEDKVALFKHALEDEQFLPDADAACAGSSFSCTRARYCPVVSLCKSAYA